MFDTSLDGYRRYVYVLNHVPMPMHRLQSSRDVRPRPRDILVTPTNVYHDTCYVWKELATGDRIWSPKDNFVRRYQYPFLSCIRSRRRLYNLRNMTFFSASTLDLRLLQQFDLEV